ncbi:uncharacterized protein LOC135491089 [Lineus longissimus]|uniref:uncharacterized protein LOC135491089 n=1 Tax=Lineus longissimus TaxID=88925 RepID=UPI00315DE905
MYVDDLLRSLNMTTQEAIQLVIEIIDMLAKGGFRITKINSNVREILRAIPQNERGKPTLDLDLDELPVERALGFEWNTEEDVFQFKVQLQEKPMTKRGVLSTLSSLYDPIGFVCPVVLEAKQIMQRLWQAKVGWDDPIPENELAV